MLEYLYSKWVEARPTPAVTKKELLAFLQEDVIARFGLPRKIISDNSNLFSSKTFTNFCRSQGIQQEFTGVEHQRANPVERKVQDLKKVMRALLISHSPRTWDDRLPKATAVLRRRTNAASGESPSKIILGYEPPLPGQWKIPRLPRDEPLVSRPEQQQILDRHAEYQLKYASPETPPPIRFEPGDLVLLRTKVRPAHPFAPTWLGPYAVIRAITDTLYEISINGVPSPRHVDSLRRAPPGNNITDNESPCDESESDNDESSTSNTETSSSEDNDEEDRRPGSRPEEVSSDSSGYEPRPPQRVTISAQINDTEQAARRKAIAPAHVQTPIQSHPAPSKTSEEPEARQTATAPAPSHVTSNTEPTNETIRIDNEQTARRTATASPPRQPAHARSTLSRHSVSTNERIH